MRKEVAELGDTYRKIGARRFWAILIPLLAWALAGAWLDGAATWPAQCDVSGEGSLGWVQKFICSPRLLSEGGAEIGMFVWLWTLPALGLLAILWVAIRRRNHAAASQEHNSNA